MGPYHKPKGLKGQEAGPTPWPAGHTLSQFGLGLGGYVHTLVHKSILWLRVGGNQEEWPAVHHLQTDSMKLVEALLYPYIRILTVEFTSHHTLLVVLHL
jgi:hypothetical protein